MLLAFVEDVAKALFVKGILIEHLITFVMQFGKLDIYSLEHVTVIWFWHVIPDDACISAHNTHGVLSRTTQHHTSWNSIAVLTFLTLYDHITAFTVFTAEGGKDVLWVYPLTKPSCQSSLCAHFVDWERHQKRSVFPEAIVLCTSTSFFQCGASLGSDGVCSKASVFKRPKLWHSQMLHVKLWPM